MPQEVPRRPQEAILSERVKLLHIRCRSVLFVLLLCPPHFRGPGRPHVRYPPGSPRKPQRGLRRPQEAQEPQEASGGPQEAPGGHKRPPYQNLSSYCTSGADSLMFSDLVPPPLTLGGPDDHLSDIPLWEPQEASGSPRGFQDATGGPGGGPRRPQEVRRRPPQHPSCAPCLPPSQDIRRHFFVSRRAPADLSTSSPGLVFRRTIQRRCPGELP